MYIYLYWAFLFFFCICLCDISEWKRGFNYFWNSKMGLNVVLREFFWSESNCRARIWTRVINSDQDPILILVFSRLDFGSAHSVRKTTLLILSILFSFSKIITIHTDTCFLTVSQNCDFVARSAWNRKTSYKYNFVSVNANTCFLFIYFNCFHFSSLV